MVLFNEYLRELLQQKGLTISALARQSGIERTALSKALAGQRMLPYHALDALIARLRLTPGEEQTLRRSYEAQFRREGLHRSREVVGKLFSDLATLDFSAPAFESRQLLLDMEQYARTHTVFSGATNVQPLLRMALTEELVREDARVELSVPPSYHFLNDELLRYCLEERSTAEITQIIAFDASGPVEDVNLYNLDCFCRVLPVCLLSRRHYHPYYYYDNVTTTQYTDPFPYFLVTHCCVICLSEDGAHAMLLRSEEQVEYFHRHFQSLLPRCRSLVEYTADPIALLRSYGERTDADGFYMVMDQPCFGRFYTDAFIEEYVRTDLPSRAHLVQAAQQRFAVLRQGKRFYTMFTQKGLERFADTGTLDDFPVALVRPFSREDRRRLMVQLAGETRAGAVTARILGPGLFPDYLSMTTSIRSGVGFFTTGNFPILDGAYSIQLQEPTLCQAFHDWLTHLADSRQALDGEATAEVLEALARA